MKRGIWCAVIVLAAGLIATGWCAPSEKAAGADERGAQIDLLTLEIETLVQSRDAALTAFQAKYAAAPLADRVALEAEGAQLTEEYERAYLELMLQNHTLTGNTVEAEHAAAMLEQMNAGPVTGVPLNLDRNLPAMEGGQPNER